MPHVAAVGCAAVDAVPHREQFGVGQRSVDPFKPFRTPGTGPRSSIGLTTSFAVDAIDARTSLRLRFLKLRVLVARVKRIGRRPILTVAWGIVPGT